MIKSFTSKEILICFMLLALLSSQAHAGRTVTSPRVAEGVSVFESKSEYIIDDDPDRSDAWRQRINLGHGITSYWSSELEGTYRDTGRDQKPAFTSLQFKNKFQLLRQDKGGFDFGFRIGYILDMSGNEADLLDFRLLASREDNSFAYTGNFILNRQMGSDASSETEWRTALSARYLYKTSFQPGFEIYNDFGSMSDHTNFQDQDHRLGPVFYGQIRKNLRYDAGYLFGISDNAPDGAAKIVLKYNF